MVYRRLVWSAFQEEEASLQVELRSLEPVVLPGCPEGAASLQVVCLQLASGLVPVGWKRAAFRRVVGLAIRCKSALLVAAHHQLAGSCLDDAQSEIRSSVARCRAGASSGHRRSGPARPNDAQLMPRQQAVRLRAGVPPGRRPGEPALQPDAPLANLREPLAHRDGGWYPLAPSGGHWDAGLVTSPGPRRLRPTQSYGRRR